MKHSLVIISMRYFQMVFKQSWFMHPCCNLCRGIGQLLSKDRWLQVQTLLYELLQVLCFALLKPLCYPLQVPTSNRTGK